jgi:1A family penicillin-binding protein
MKNKNYTPELLIVIVAIAGLFIAAPLITQAKYATDITSKEQIVNKKNTGIILLDRNGKQFFSFNNGKFREYTPLSKISRHVQHAVIAAEDETFYEHNGVSTPAIVGAMIANFRKGEMNYGGSTITQQLVKNTLLDHKRHVFRKYEEIVVAQEIEDQYSKSEILEMYLNSVYFGEGAYGIEEAARTYFNKHASSLDISEASMLAGIIAAPSRLSPVSGDKKKAKERQIYVLNEMAEDRYISAGDNETARQKKLAYKNGSARDHYLAPHFALLVKQKLIEQYGEEYVTSSGMKVHTTLDLTWQSHAEEAVIEQVQNLAVNNGSNASVVVMDPKTGEVRALVGSADWYNNKFGKVNMAVTPRQTGSAFKPIVYLAGLEDHRITPATVLLDVPKTFGKNYRPKNYDDRFRGPVSARYALANSLNVPSVEVMTRVGLENSLAMAKRLGIESLGTASNYGPSLVLGTGEVTLLELTSAYATFANEGERHEPQLVTSIEDRYGKVVYRYQRDGYQVVDKRYVFLISSILSDERTRRDVFGNALDISRTAAVKTGTTEDYKDAWTVGYTPSLAIGVWVGNNNNAAMDRIAGSLGAAPIWRNLMEQLTTGTAVERFDVPSGVVAKSVCGSNGRRSFRGNSFEEEYFIAGTESRGCAPRRGSNFAFRRDFDGEFNNFFESLIKPTAQPFEQPRVGAVDTPAPQDQPQPSLLPSPTPEHASPTPQQITP